MHENFQFWSQILVIKIVFQRPHVILFIISKVSSTFRISWDMFVGFLIVYSVIDIPMKVGFDLANEGLWFWINVCIDITFGLDICLNFITAYEKTIDTGHLLITTYKGNKRCWHKRMWMKGYRTLGCVSRFAILFVMLFYCSIDNNDTHFLFIF